MTEDEKAKLKAEITAQLGQQLDEHYVTKKDFKEAFEFYGKELTTELTENLGPKFGKKLDEMMGDFDDRLRMVEFYISFKTKHETMRAGSNARNWMWVAGMVDSFAKTIRKRMYTWFSDMQKKNIVPEGMEGYASQILDTLEDKSS